MSFRTWIFITLGIFGAGIALGLIAPAGLAGLLAKDLAALEKLAALLAPFKVTTAIFIFLKNASTLLLAFIFSPFFCLLPILSLLVNGWLLSFVAVAVSQERSLGFVLAGLLPHGIFELPALIIGEAAALSFGFMAIMALVSEQKRPLFLPNLKRNLKYLLIAWALLVPAAIIETYITPLFIGA